MFPFEKSPLEKQADEELKAGLKQAKLDLIVDLRRLQENQPVDETRSELMES